MPGSQDITQYPVLHDEEASPSPPGPYCVLDITEPVPLHHSTSKLHPHAEHHVQSSIVNFRIHARKRKGLSAKAVAIKLAQRLVEAFDDAPLDLFPGKMCSWTRMPDFGAKEDDEGYVRVVPYEIVYDKLIARSVRRKTETG